MTARQDIDVTTVSTANSFNILRNLQAHRWTLSATAHLNATYTALQSTLVHPDAPMAPHGDMDYMNAGVDVGPVAQYVNGAFQTSLSVPVAVAYTSLRNASVAGEETDADRVRLRVQPSFSLLWKANNNFTFKANAHYSTNETPWTKLVTANMMGNYRSLSRYRATLDDSHGAGANTKFRTRTCSAACLPTWRAHGRAHGATLLTARRLMGRRTPLSRPPICPTIATTTL